MTVKKGRTQPKAKPKPVTDAARRAGYKPPRQLNQPLPKVTISSAPTGKPDKKTELPTENVRGTTRTTKAAEPIQNKNAVEGALADPNRSAAEKTAIEQRNPAEFKALLKQAEQGITEAQPVAPLEAGKLPEGVAPINEKSTQIVQGTDEQGNPIFAEAGGITPEQNAAGNKFATAATPAFFTAAIAAPALAGAASSTGSLIASSGLAKGTLLGALAYALGKAGSFSGSNLKTAEQSLGMSLDAASRTINEVKAGITPIEQAEYNLQIASQNIADLERALKVARKTNAKVILSNGQKQEQELIFAKASIKRMQRQLLTIQAGAQLRGENEQGLNEPN